MNSNQYSTPRKFSTEQLILQYPQLNAPQVSRRALLALGSLMALQSVGCSSSSSSVINACSNIVGTVTTLAGSSTTTSGFADGTGGAATFNHPYGIAVDSTGNLYVAEYDNHIIRKIVASSGVVTTLAGSATNAGYADGTGTAAQFNYPCGITIDNSGNLYVADRSNFVIRKIVISSGVVTTLAGTAGAGGATDGTGSAARFYDPVGITFDGNANLYVAGNNLIRQIVISSGVVTTLAGTTASGSIDGTGTAARFNAPIGVSTDGIGNLYVADTSNNLIRKIVISTGVVTTLAGSTSSGALDGTGTSARFNAPYGVAANCSDTLYVTDGANNMIRKVIVSTGIVTTLAGSTTAGATDGTGVSASFRVPVGIAADGNGKLFITDHNNHSIRQIV